MNCRAIKPLFSGKRVACTAAMALAMALSAPSFGQGCGGTITPNPVPGFTTFAVGQDLEIEVEFGPTGNSATITTMVVVLECFNAGGCSLSCTPGNSLSYLGDATIAGNTCGVGITSNNPGGGSTGTVTFTFNPALNLAAGATCKFRFGVSIESLSGDGTAKQITGTTQFNGTCANGLPLSQCGSYLIPVVSPDIEVTKSACPELICEGTSTPVTYTYEVTTGSGNAPISNVVLTDDTCGPGGPNTPIPLSSGDTNNNGILDPTETWIYTCTTNISQATENTATVNGAFVNSVGSIPVNDDDNAEVLAVVITSSPATCGVQYCASIEDAQGNPACPGSTCTWRFNGQIISTDCCLTLDSTDPPGNYCVTMTCPGTTSCPGGGPIVRECCVNFTPPQGPSCTINVGPCPYPVTLTAVPTNCNGCTYQWGTADAAHTTCTPLPGETGTTLIVNADGHYCVTVTDDQGCQSTCYVFVQCVEVGEGCTPGYWKQCQHFHNWVCSTAPVLNLCPVGPTASCHGGPVNLGCPGCTKATKFNEVFENAFPKTCGGTSKTLLEVLKQPASHYPSGCGSNALNNLGRHTVAALLNAAKLGANYSPTYSTPQAVIDAFNAVYPGSSSDYNALKNIFAGLNEQGCPLNGFADLNNSGLVNQADLDILMANWGNPGVGDINRDGIVDGLDVVILISWWGQ